MRSWLRALVTGGLVLGVLAGCAPDGPSAGDGSLGPSDAATPSPTGAIDASPSVSIAASVPPTADPGAPPTPVDGSGHVEVFRYPSGAMDNGPLYTVNDEGTSGSGCVPPAGATLPDGVWGGLVTTWGARSLSFDLVCVYGPDTPRSLAEFASCMAVEDPYDPDHEGCGIAHMLGRYDNDSGRLRELPVASGATYIDSYMQDTEMPIGGVSSLEGWGTYRGGGLMWVYINDGLVTQVLVQYYP